MLTTIIFPAYVQAENTEYGKTLHETHCMQCHTPDIYTRENRLVNSFTELQERVRQCELSNELTWFDEDIDAVIDYLNTSYYRFNTD